MTRKEFEARTAFEKILMDESERIARAGQDKNDTAVARITARTDALLPGLQDARAGHAPHQTRTANPLEGRAQAVEIEIVQRSEERRVGKEGRARCLPY